MIRTYSELSKLKTFQQRFDYLKVPGIVGQQTFGFQRLLNQAFYHSKEWRQARQNAIIRDNGCDLGIEGFSIFDKIIVHHMNPITLQMIEDRDPDLWNIQYLICTADVTHKAIHYSGVNPNDMTVFQRTKGDTILWKPVSSLR